MTSLTRREKGTSFLAAIVAGLLVMLVFAPLAEAAAKKVKIVDSNGDAIESEVIPDMGLLQAEGSSGAIATRTFAGGGGFLGAGDCTETTADGRPNFIETSNSIVTGILMTGTDATITVTSQAVGGGQLPLIKFRLTADNPNEFVGLGNGLTATAPLRFTCAGTDADFVLLGQ
jgi:hypothetical protein